MNGGSPGTSSRAPAGVVGAGEAVGMRIAARAA
jgi:hypothetical protein